MLGTCFVKLILTFGDLVFINVSQIAGVKFNTDTTSVVEMLNSSYYVEGNLEQVMREIRTQCKAKS